MQVQTKCNKSANFIIKMATNYVTLLIHWPQSVNFGWPRIDKIITIYKNKVQPIKILICEIQFTS